MNIDKIYICTINEENHYIFKCMNCNKEYELITGNGRYGNLGEFDCPNCKEKYYATIDDHQNPSLYVTKYGEQPSSMLDLEGKKRRIEIKNDGLGFY